MENTVDGGRKLTISERRNRVALELQAGKSCRAIARELGVDDKTIGTDKTFLETPEDQRIIKVRRQRKPPPRPNHDQLLNRMLKALQTWIFAQKLILPDIEWVLNKAGRLLHAGRKVVGGLPESTLRPAKLLEATRPESDVVEGMSAKDAAWANNEHCAKWLARCLACYAPREEGLRDDLLRLTSIWARENHTRFG
jgi:hypothetical protein